MAAKPVKIRAKIKNGVAVVKALMPHPMETGTRRDAEGNIIAAHFIEEVVCKLNDTVVLTTEWGTSVSKNPYFAFKVKGAKSGDQINISWKDNMGETSEGSITLK